MSQGNENTKKKVIRIGETLQDGSNKSRDSSSPSYAALISGRICTLASNSGSVVAVEEAMAEEVVKRYKRVMKISPSIVISYSSFFCSVKCT